MSRTISRVCALFLLALFLAGELTLPVAAVSLTAPRQNGDPAPPASPGAHATTSAKVYLPLISEQINIQITHIELTQAIQTPHNSVPLVLGRPTVARLFVRSSYGEVAGLTVTLSARRHSVLLGGSPITRTGIRATENPDRARPSQSVNILLPAGWVADDIVLTAQVFLPGGTIDAIPADNSKRLIVSFVRVPPLKVAIVPVKYVDSDKGDVFEAPTSFGFPSSLQAMFPVPSLSLRKRAPVTFVGDLSKGYPTYEGWVRLLDLTEALAVADGAPDAELYLSVVRTVPWSPLAGLATMSSRSAVTFDYDLVPAHEVGHTLGRYHAPCGNPPGADPGYPYADGRIGQYGWDTRTGRVLSPGEHDVMSYCEAWVSDYTYLGLMYNQIASGRPEAGAAEAAPVVLFQADVTPGREAQIMPLYTLESGRSRPASAPDYTVAFLDGAGSLLAEHAVQSRWFEEEGYAAQRISALVAKPAGPVAWVELRRNGAVVAQRAVNRPAAGASTQEMTASIAGEEMVLAFAPTAGIALVRHLHPQGVDSFPVDASTGLARLPLSHLAGGAASFQLIRPDVIPAGESPAALLTASAQATLPDRAPEAWIGGPRQAPYGAGVIVDGYASDPEDGALTSLRWSVNGQTVAEGPFLQLDEVRSVLNVELRATDSAGQSASAQILLSPIAEPAD